MKNKKPKNMTLRYSIVNLIGGILDIVFLFIFVQFFEIFYLYAAIYSFVLSDGIEYYYYRNHLFKVKGIKVWRLVKYVFFKAINLGILLGLLWLFVSYLEIYYLLSRVLAGILVMIIGVIMQSKFTFKN